MKKRVKKKIFWMLPNLTKRLYLCCEKHRYQKSPCISKCLIPWKHIYLERAFNNQFNNLIMAVKLPTIQRSLVFGSSDWEPDRYSEYFLSKFLKIIFEEFIFANVTGYRPAVLLKKEFFLRHFSKILPIDSVGKIIDKLFWGKPFKSEHFRWLLLFMPKIS